MTVSEIHDAVSKVKSVSRPQLYNYFEVLKIEPIGARQKPQQYPADSADRILIHLGLNSSAVNARNGVAGLKKSARLVSLPELKRERSNARRGK